MKTLLGRYRKFAEAHGKYTFDGDSRRTNRAHDQLLTTLSELIETGSDSDLFLLYDDADINVQCWAAVHTLELNEKTALQKLQEIEVQNIPIVSMSAKYSIIEWQNGNLRVRAL